MNRAKPLREFTLRPKPLIMPGSIWLVVTSIFISGTLSAASAESSSLAV